MKKILKLDRYLIFLLSIFLLALFLRLFQLSQIPSGFHIDEASLGYNAYSFLLTGKDEAGHRFPLYIDMFGDNRPTGYHYLTILPVKLFGLTVFATRLPAALFGALSVFSLYYLALALLRDKKIALVSSILLAIAPWHITISRASGEAVIALFFILSGFAFIIYGMKNERLSHLYIGSVLSTVSFFFYHTPRLFVPILFFSFLAVLTPLLFWKKSKKITRHLVISFGLVLSLALFLVFFAKGGTGRFAQVSIFGFPETRLVMEEQIREDGISKVSLLETRIFHNKPVNYTLTFLENYFSYFTANFLFIRGGLPAWYKVPNMGLLYLVELPFILAGLYYLLKEKDIFSKLPLVWILIAPVTAAITFDDVPNINRVLVLFPMLELLTSCGFFFLLKNYKKLGLIITTGTVILLACNFFYFLHQYFVHMKIHQNWYRNYGVQELTQELKKSYDKYDRIIITKSAGGIYPIILFYSQFDPKTYQEEGSTKNDSYTGFGKYFFVPQECPSVNKDNRFPRDEKTIFVDRGDCPDDGSIAGNKKTIIKRTDNSSEFRIVYTP